MNLAGMSSIGSYLKMMKMQNTWQQKQEKGTYTAASESQEEQAILSCLDRLAEEAKESKDKMTIQAIYTKVQMGKKLTREEKEYLRENDQATYMKVNAAEQKRKAFERELKACRTKEEVQRLKFTYQSESLASIKSISNNPNIPEGEKLGLILAEYAKSQAIEEAVRDFQKRGEYAELPTDEEYAQAMKEMKEAKEPVAEEDSEENAEISSEKENLEKPQEIPDSDLTEKPLNEEGKTEKTTKKTDQEPDLESEKVKKVKRAKAKAAYKATAALEDPSENTALFRNFRKKV